MRYIKNLKHMITAERCQSKTLILSTKVDQKLLEPVWEFSGAICRQSKWQSKTLFLAIFDPRLSIVKVVFDCRLSGVLIIKIQSQKIEKNMNLSIW